MIEVADVIVKVKSAAYRDVYFHSSYLILDG